MIHHDMSVSALCLIFVSYFTVLRTPCPWKHTQKCDTSFTPFTTNCIACELWTRTVAWSLLFFSLFYRIRIINNLILLKTSTKKTGQYDHPCDVFYVTQHKHSKLVYSIESSTINLRKTSRQCMNHAVWYSVYLLDFLLAWTFWNTNKLTLGFG